MTDAIDLVRAFFEAVNRSDAVAVGTMYHAACIVENVFIDDAGVYEGVEAARQLWATEFARYLGVQPGGRRFEVHRISGIETGWGWARADWRSAVQGHAGIRRQSGYSHFWVEDGLIRRHRTVARDEPSDRVDDVSTAAGDAGPDRASSREYPTKPVVGVGAVIVDDKRRVVLVKRRYEPLAGQWSLPGGGLEIGETLEAGTAREVREETGLVVDVGPVVEVFDRILADESGRVRYHFVLVDYLCRPREGRLHAGTDVAEVALVEPDALGPYRVTEKAVAVIERALKMVDEI
jgi:ADP-ribose pyrophosphatase YjhB (NUDIX family)